MNTFDDERMMQRYVNDYYQERGYSSDRTTSCKQYDLRLYKNDYSYLVEEKFNFTDREYKDMIVELIQDAKSGDLGWFYHVKCDRLHWFYCPVDRISRPNVLYSIDWFYFKDYVFDRMKEWVSMHFNDQGYGLTLNMRVCLADLVSEGIANKYELNQLSLWGKGL